MTSSIAVKLLPWMASATIHAAVISFTLYITKEFVSPAKIAFPITIINQKKFTQLTNFFTKNDDKTQAKKDINSLKNDESSSFFFKNKVPQPSLSPKNGGSALISQTLNNRSKIHRQFMTQLSDTPIDEGLSVRTIARPRQSKQKQSMYDMKTRFSSYFEDSKAMESISFSLPYLNINKAVLVPPKPKAKPHQINPPSVGNRHKRNRYPHYRVTNYQSTPNKKTSKFGKQYNTFPTGFYSQPRHTKAQQTRVPATYSNRQIQMSSIGGGRKPIDRTTTPTTRTISKNNRVVSKNYEIRKISKLGQVIGDPSLVYHKPSLLTVGSVNRKPRYPLKAIKRGYEGKVILSVQISKFGYPSNIELIKSSGHNILDGTAKSTVLNWRFRAARIGKKPISDKLVIPIIFKLKQ